MSETKEIPLQDALVAGQEILKRLDPTGQRQRVTSAFSPEAAGFDDLTQSLVYGQIWSRPGLSLADRELVTTAVLAALGRERQLSVHLGHALNAGVSRRRLTEALIQLAPYAGWPAAVTALTLAQQVFQQRDQTAQQAGLWQRLQFGAARITFVTDGQAALPLPFLVSRMEIAGIEEALQASQVPTEIVPVSLNPVVLELDGQLVVIDPGSGPAAQVEGNPASPGQFVTNFVAAGFQLEEVDLVILTHAHADHATALLDANGELRFPKAKVALSEIEFLHWRDRGDFGVAQLDEETLRQSREQGQKLTQAIASRTVWLQHAQEILPGLTALFSPGHTAGHMALLLRQGTRNLLFAGEAATSEFVHLPFPETYTGADFDPANTVVSKRQLLESAADQNWLVHGFHFRFPGLGTVSRQDGGYRFTPVSLEEPQVSV